MARHLGTVAKDQWRLELAAAGNAPMGGFSLFCLVRA
jgi:hypothetical protein